MGIVAKGFAEKIFEKELLTEVGWIPGASKPWGSTPQLARVDSLGSLPSLKKKQGEDRITGAC